MTTPPRPGEAGDMRLLVLGGTVFLSRAVAAAAVGAGHEVVCAARGRSGSVPAGAELVEVDRDVSHAPLRGSRFDAVVDVATMSLPWVRDALAAVDAGHWTFVSSINAYADTATRGQTAAAPLLAPRSDVSATTPEDPELYGTVKVACEEAVRAAYGDRALVVRGGLMCGPGDVWDRFGYWAARFARGGRAVVPEVPGHPAQVVDVRDLAEWIVRSAEQGLGGTFDGTAPGTTLAALLDEVAAAVGAPDLELVGRPAEELAAAGVGIWAGPRSLPLWLPESHWGIVDRDVSATLAAGFTARPLAETARAALAWERELGADRPRVAGLTAAEEAALL
ncbi:NAD-dependent epimerase/dehydratase family protein [Pseudonocardia lutea]|uniref:NAD-dependent epimerase/dehydratase family protein n=1 Tax=Pseudonocardia lutea TaxID=2172015 RepID=A0ABW1IDA9_9PSEU